MSARQASVSRKTAETQIDVEINLDCGPNSNNVQVIDVKTGIGFLDHVHPQVISLGLCKANTLQKMYSALAKHSGMSLSMKCDGDLWIDDHHTADK